jgi:hypothetical protein
MTKTQKQGLGGLLALFVGVFFAVAAVVQDGGGAMLGIAFVLALVGAAMLWVATMDTIQARGTPPTTRT